MQKYTLDLIIFLKTILQLIILTFCAYFFIKAKIYGYFFDTPQIIDMQYLPAFVVSVVVFATITSIVRDYFVVVDKNIVDKNE